ncbi:uncharacterized protein LOC111794869 [Cucurbita pepo subsp. pepo]|uniref:uncharacterized protein LOC111794869 n=1 Tax=Cucurbita pepo subsp. pepo TaxID=3664 RepID=UPI000C9D45D1|nr:uncharacterized protein LOC111794869 [Cucurbita pepo subsp. pepo]
MESVSFCDIRTEKMNAILKYRQLRKIANLFRFIELCLILVVISKLSIHLPSAFKNSGEYFRCLSMTLISPRFVFLIGNAIVITLFAKSGQFSGTDLSKKNSVADLYEEFIQNSEKNQRTRRAEIKYRIKQIDSGSGNVQGDASIDYRIKQIDSGSGSGNVHGDASIKYRIKQIDSGSGNASITIKKIGNPEEIKHYRRSQSEKIAVVQRENPHSKLSRSETEKSKKIVRLSEGTEQISYPEDGMSNEEFQEMVEAFIARQQRLRREEEFCGF